MPQHLPQEWRGPLFTMADKAGIDRPPVGVSYGMGVDSTALLIGLHDLGLRPDVVLTADTGGEKPVTYQFLFIFDEWLAGHGFNQVGSTWHRPPGYEDMGLPEHHILKCIVAVANDGKYGTLEKNCRVKKMVPSLAYGGRSCSEKYKHRPMHKWCKNHWQVARAWTLARTAGSTTHVMSWSALPARTSSPSLPP